MYVANLGADAPGYGKYGARPQPPTGWLCWVDKRRTIERYDALLPLVRTVYLMPVLQGYTPHIDAYSVWGACAGAMAVT
jgi:hypothetical protein